MIAFIFSILPSCSKWTRKMVRSTPLRLRTAFWLYPEIIGLLVDNNSHILSCFLSLNFNINMGILIFFLFVCTISEHMLFLSSFAPYHSIVQLTASSWKRSTEPSRSCHLLLLQWLRWRARGCCWLNVFFFPSPLICHRRSPSCLLNCRWHPLFLSRIDRCGKEKKTREKQEGPG